jgi:hypothetical protein
MRAHTQHTYLITFIVYWKGKKIRINIFEEGKKNNIIKET